MPPKTKIKASQVTEDTLEDKDGNTKVSVETSSNEDKIRFDTAGAERMIIDNTGKVGIGISSPSSTLHVQGNLNNSYVVTLDNDENTSGHVLKLNTDGTGNNTNLLEMEKGGGDIIFRARADGRFGFGPDGVNSMGAGTFVVGIDNSSHTSDIAISRRMQHLGDSDTYLDFPANNSIVLTSGGNDAISIDDGGHVKFNQGIKYSKGILVSSASSPAGSGGTQDGGWIKFATFSCPGTSGLDTASSTFLITIAGMESSNNRALDGTFIVTAKFTNNNDGTGTDNASISNAYYEPEGTYLYCEPLNADRLSAAGVNEFNPATDLLMIFPNNTSTPDVDLYIRACAKTKRLFATHLGGTGQTDTFDTDIGFTINTGQSWSATEPVAPANNVKLTGTWASKVFSKLDVYGDTAVGGKIGIMVESNTPSQPLDGEGYIYSKSDGKLYWRSHDINEVDLTAGGGGTSKHFAIGHVDLTTNNKPVNWINASSISASSGIKSWYIVPFAGTIDKVIVSVKANNFDNTNDGNITLSIFKNQADYGSTIVNQTVGANDFTEKVSNMAGGTTDCNQKIFAGLNQSIAEGDLIHVKVGKSTGADREAIVTLIYTS